MKKARQLAAESLMQVGRRGAWSNLVLDSVLRQYKPEPRDSALISALFYGVLERGVTLNACIAAHSKTPLEKLSPQVAEVLRLGLYQLLYMDSIPDHAAVAESVDLVRTLGKPKAAGFVNGVLRAFLRTNKAIPLPKGPKDLRLSVEYACPLSLVQFWLKSYGEAETIRVLKASLGRPPLFVRVNTLLITPGELISRLAAHGVEAKEDKFIPNCLELENAGALRELPEFKRGFFHVQDKASQLCAAALGVTAGSRVLDTCAAPGGKSFTLAELMGDEGEIISCDIHEHRVGLIKERQKKLQIKCVKPEARDMTIFDTALGAFDFVLCDVPCSGLGTIRRKPELKRKFAAGFSEIAELPDLQYKLLFTASQYCKANGRVIYSTCTLNPAENEQIVARFLRENPDFAPASLPEFLGGGSSKTFLGELDADGFFISAITRK
jgi:16S rRNA (cytosine967-C5)-methyltransferase